MPDFCCSHHRMTVSCPTYTGLATKSPAQVGDRRAWARIRMLLIVAGVAAASSSPVLSQTPLLPAVSGELAIGGTGSALGTMRRLATVFETKQPGVRITILPSLGSGGGIQALLAGKLTLSVASRPLTEAERAKALVSKEMATTAFVFAVANSTPVTNLTLDELAALYSGKTSTWSDGSLVRPVLRPPSDVDTQIVKEMSPSLNSAIQAAHLRPGKNIAVTDGDSADEIEAIGGAIGTSSLALILSESRNLRVVALGGIAPTATNVLAGTYPYKKSIYLVTLAIPSEATIAFMAFIDSAEGAAILQSTGNIPIGIPK
jgi:phosphate transport system substrate-binding protein